MKVSIITTVYQAENDLPRLLDSMVAQQSHDLEFLLINNGCTDGSAAICAEYASRDSRFKILTLDKNIGYIAARNLGLNTVNADYVGFCDSDDCLEPGGYDKAIEAIKATECDFYIAGWNVRNGDCCRKFLPPFKSGLHDKSSLQKNLLPQFFGSLSNRPMMQAFMWKQLIRKSLISNVDLKFIEFLKPCEDIVFNATIACSAKSVYIDYNTIYNYIVSESSITGKMVSSYDLSREYQRSKELHYTLLKITDNPICKLANANKTLYSIVTMISRLEQTVGIKRGLQLFRDTIELSFIKEICNDAKPKSISMKVFSFLLEHGYYKLLFRMSKRINSTRNVLNNIPPTSLKSLPKYSVAIRTLGTSGEKYLRLLKSLDKQTLKPKK